MGRVPRACKREASVTLPVGDSSLESNSELVPILSGTTWARPRAAKGSHDGTVFGIIHVSGDVARGRASHHQG